MCPIIKKRTNPTSSSTRASILTPKRISIKASKILEISTPHPSTIHQVVPLPCSLPHNSKKVKLSIKSAHPPPCHRTHPPKNQPLSSSHHTSRKPHRPTSRPPAALATFISWLTGSRDRSDQHRCLHRKKWPRRGLRRKKSTNGVEREGGRWSRVVVVVGRGMVWEEERW